MMKKKCMICEKFKELHHFGENSKIWINGKQGAVCRTCLRKRPKTSGSMAFKLPGSKTKKEQERYRKEAEDRQ